MKIQHKQLALVLCALVSTFLAPGATATLSAQDPRPNPAYTLPADSLLAHFERDARALKINNLGEVWINQVLGNPKAPPARRDSLLDGLERMAITSTSPYVRRFAVGYVAQYMARSGFLVRDARRPQP